MKIYTKFGDQGQTRLVGGSTVEKDNGRIDTYGTIDELNSHIGLSLSSLPDNEGFRELRTDLTLIQHHLFDLGSHLACEKDEIRKRLPPFPETHTQWLESRIDHMTQELPPLKEFILPGGHIGSCHLHLCRTVCRRSERLLVRFQRTSPHSIQSIGIQYLNRLSDYFFTTARFVNHRCQIPETTWQKGFTQK